MIGETRITKLPNGPFLSPGESVGAVVVVRKLDRTEFVVGTYRVTVSLADTIRSLHFDDGSPWSGRAKQADTRDIVVLEIRTVEDRIEFLDIEGNYHLGARRYSEAVPYLQELVQLKPEAWQPNAALGAALMQLKRYREAIGPLERALPGWLRFTERRGDFLANQLAQAYLALNSNVDAVRVLRSAGVSEREIRERIQRLSSPR